MTGIARKHTVTVYGKQCDLLVCQSSKTIWVSIGKYDGRDVQGRGRTEIGAIQNWIMHVQYQESE